MTMAASPVSNHEVTDNSQAWRAKEVPSPGGGMNRSSSSRRMMWKSPSTMTERASTGGGRVQMKLQTSRA
jgi:hypothetical protein